MQSRPKTIRVSWTFDKNFERCILGKFEKKSLHRMLNSCLTWSIEQCFILLKIDQKTAWNRVCGAIVVNMLVKCSRANIFIFEKSSGSEWGKWGFRLGSENSGWFSWAAYYCCHRPLHIIGMRIHSFGVGVGSEKSPTLRALVQSLWILHGPYSAQEFSWKWTRVPKEAEWVVFIKLSQDF